MVTHHDVRGTRLLARPAGRFGFALCMSFAMATLASTVEAQTYRYVGQLGTSGAGTLNFPNDVQIDPATRNVYVSDTGNDRVVVFDSAGNYVNAFGSSGSGNGQFDYPAGIGIDPVSHTVYVADYYGGRVEAFSSSGVYLNQFGPNNTWTPCDIVIRPGTRDVIVSDGYGATVRIYNSSENYLSQFGNTDNFDYPCDMAIAANGNIIVSDETNNNVQIFDANGGYIGQFGGPGTGNGQFSFPAGIGVEAGSKNIIVVDYGHNRVQTFDENGTYLGQFGSPGAGPGQFNGPVGLAIDPVSHDLLIDDRGNNRVQRFAPCGATLVSLSVLPLTQALNQPIFFSASIGNVESPSGVVSMYSDSGGLVCTATTYGDPQASCSGNLVLGQHAVTAVYSGSGAIPSGCSAAAVVTVIDNTNLSATNATLLISPGDPFNRFQGKPITLTESISAPPGAAANSANAVATAYSGFVTFYDGSSVLASVPLANNQAEYSNAFVGGVHQFSAVYSGDGVSATSSDNATITVTAPADGVFYGGFEVPPGP